MKMLLLLIALLLSTGAFPQEAPEKTNPFVRVYDLQGTKFSKGKILSISDSTLQLKGSSLINIRDIGFIKTKRSGGHNILMGAVSLAGISAIAGAATADPDDLIGYSPGEGAAVGIVLGGTAGAALGGLSILAKNSRTYVIHGDAVQWKAFRDSLPDKGVTTPERR